MPPPASDTKIAAVQNGGVIRLAEAADGQEAGRSGCHDPHACGRDAWLLVAPCWGWPAAGDAAIRRFIDGWNDRCQPFAWTKPAGEILTHATSKETS